MTRFTHAPRIEQLESRNVPSTSMWMQVFGTVGSRAGADPVDAFSPYPHNTIDLVQTELRGQEALSWAIEEYGTDKLGIRWIQDGQDIRKLVKIDSDGDGLQNDRIPIKEYTEADPHWRDSSRADPLRVFVEAVPNGLTIQQAQQSVDRVLAQFDGFEHLYLEQTYNPALAQIVIGTFYTEPSLRFSIAYAFQPDVPDFDGTIQIGFNNVVQWQQFDDYFPVRFDWQWEHPGAVEGPGIGWHPPSGQFGYEQVLLHEITLGLGISETSGGIGPTVRSPFYDPEHESHLQWQDIADLELLGY